MMMATCAGTLSGVDSLSVSGSTPAPPPDKKGNKMIDLTRSFQEVSRNIEEFIKEAIEEAREEIESNVRAEINELRNDIERLEESQS